MKKGDLDKKICDCEKDAENDLTYREYIRISENLFKIEHSDLDIMSNEEVINYLDFIDELYLK